jgi:hypothetical protein
MSSSGRPISISDLKDLSCLFSRSTQISLSKKKIPSIRCYHGRGVGRLLTESTFDCAILAFKVAEINTYLREVRQV